MGKLRAAEEKDSMAAKRHKDRKGDFVFASFALFRGYL